MGFQDIIEYITKTYIIQRTAAIRKSEEIQIAYFSILLCIAIAVLWEIHTGPKFVRAIV